MFINVICVYLGILVSYTISISDDIVKQEQLTIPDPPSSTPFLVGFALLELSM